MPTPDPHAPPRPLRLAVMISGGGRTMANLAACCAARTLNARIALVIASSECAGVTRARELGLECRVIPSVIPARELGSLLEASAVDAVVLAGYLKFVNVPAGFEGRVVNIHPSLLPRFGGKGMYGHHVHEAVIAAGERVSGCTVHLVDSEYDHGRVVLQRSCPVLPDDTPDTLAARVFAQETLAYPEALSLLDASWRAGRP